MTSRSSKIIAILFLVIIFLFGSTTLLKCTDVVKEVLDTKELFSKNDEIESQITKRFKSRYNWINLNGLFQKMVGTTIVRDPGGSNVYRLNNGQLMYNLKKQDMRGYAKHVNRIYLYAKEKGVDFLYVQLPFKIESNDEMPPGTVTHGNENADNLVKLLKEKDVPVLDIREKIQQENYEYSDLFFRTDHHWKPSTALWAAGLIADRVSADYGFQYSPKIYDIQNYHIKTYEDWFLGSMGKRTGYWYSGIDDFDVITPKFETSFQFWADSRSGVLERQGAFDQALLDQRKIKKKDYFDVNTYAGYTGGDYKLNVVKNLMVENNKSILLVRDSFSCAMMPYLALLPETLTTIDMRHYKEMSVAQYLDTCENDLLIIAYNPSAFSQKQFDFFHDEVE